MFKEYKAIITLKSGMHRIIRMSYAEVAHALKEIKACVLIGKYNKVRIIRESTHELFLEF